MADIRITGVSEEFKNRLRGILVDVARLDGEKPLTLREAGLKALTLWMVEREQYIAFRRKEMALAE